MLGTGLEKRLFFKQLEPLEKRPIKRSWIVSLPTGAPNREPLDLRGQQVAPLCLGPSLAEAECPPLPESRH